MPEFVALAPCRSYSLVASRSCRSEDFMKMSVTPLGEGLESISGKINFDIIVESLSGKTNIMGGEWEICCRLVSLDTPTCKDGYSRCETVTLGSTGRNSVTVQLDDDIPQGKKYVIIEMSPVRRLLKLLGWQGPNLTIPVT